MKFKLNYKYNKLAGNFHFESHWLFDSNKKRTTTLLRKHQIKENKPPKLCLFLETLALNWKSRAKYYSQ